MSLKTSIMPVNLALGSVVNACLYHRRAFWDQHPVYLKVILYTFRTDLVWIRKSISFLYLKFQQNRNKRKSILSFRNTQWQIYKPAKWTQNQPNQHVIFHTVFYVCQRHQLSSNQELNYLRLDTFLQKNLVSIIQLSTCLCHHHLFSYKYDI